MGLLLLGIAFYAYEYILRVLPGTMMADSNVFAHLTFDQISHFSFFYYVGYTLMQIPVGIMFDRYQGKKLMIIACLLCAMGNSLFLYLNHSVLANSGRLLVGIGSSFAFIGVLLLARFHQKLFPLTAGCIISVAMLSGMIGDQLLMYGFHSIGFYITLMIFIGIALVLASLFYLYFPDKQFPNEFKFSELKLLFANTQLLINGVCGGLLYMPLAIFAELWGIRFFHYHDHLTLQQATTMNGLLFIGWAMGAPCLGWVSSKHDPRKTQQVATLCTVGFMFAIIFYSGSNRWLIALLTLSLGFFASAQILVISIARTLSPAKFHGTVLAFTNCLVMLIVSLCIVLAKKIEFLVGLQIGLLLMPMGALVAWSLLHHG